MIALHAPGVMFLVGVALGALLATWIMRGGT